MDKEKQKLQVENIRFDEMYAGLIRSCKEKEQNLQWKCGNLDVHLKLLLKTVTEACGSNYLKWPSDLDVEISSEWKQLFF